MDISQILFDWDKVKSTYEEFGKFVENRVVGLLQDMGILSHVYCRLKDETSIIKKLYKDGISEENYRNMTDKIGIRILCRFKTETELIAQGIRIEFKIVKEEDKSELLRSDQMGYKSIHFDIKLREDNTPPELYQRTSMCVGEIQLRTLCQDVWAEINHDLGYKPLIELPSEIARQIYCLGGLLEIADDTVSNLNDKILGSVILDEIYALKILEPEYIRIFRSEYNPEWTFTNLKILLPLCKSRDYMQFKNTISNFINTNRDKIIQIVNETKGERRYNPFLTQPEIILIFYLIEYDLFSLKEFWEKYFPINDLDKLSTWWGKPLSSIMEIE